MNLKTNLIHHGDNVAVLKTFPDACVDLVVTSPPYDNLRTYGGHSWDFESVARQLARVLKPGGVIVWVVNDATIKGSETLTSMRQAIFFKDVCGLNIETMIWEKTGNGCLGSQSFYNQTFEYCFLAVKGSPKSRNFICDRPNVRPAGSLVRAGHNLGKDGKAKAHRMIVSKAVGKRNNIWRICEQRGSDHPAAFPEQLAHDHIISWSNEGDIVLDPFAGSGTTCKVAQDLKRQYIGIEVHDEYVRLCEKRVKPKKQVPRYHKELA